MSNFQFLEPEFSKLALTAKEAEKLVYISPQAALMFARNSLENLVFWLYQYDKKLTQPYDPSLYSLITDVKFKEIIPLPYIWDKMDNIRMVGNSAVHGKKFKQLTTEETVKHISHLFLIFVWFERNYGSPSKDRSQAILFNPKLIPIAVLHPVVAFGGFGIVVEGDAGRDNVNERKPVVRQPGLDQRRQLLFVAGKASCHETGAELNGQLAEINRFQGVDAALLALRTLVGSG